MLITQLLLFDDKIPLIKKSYQVMKRMSTLTLAKMLSTKSRINNILTFWLINNNVVCFYYDFSVIISQINLIEFNRF